MSLSDAQRVRYARHILLPEVGEAGQAQLTELAVHAVASGEREAAEVAQMYLERAGVSVRSSAPDSHAFALASPQSIAKLSGGVELREAARALAGAFAAVEALKTLLHVGSPASLPDDFSLASEEA